MPPTSSVEPTTTRRAVCAGDEEEAERVKDRLACRPNFLAANILAGVGQTADPLVVVVGVKVKPLVVVKDPEHLNRKFNLRTSQSPTFKPVCIQHHTDDLTLQK